MQRILAAVAAALATGAVLTATGVAQDDATTTTTTTTPQSSRPDRPPKPTAEQRAQFEAARTAHDKKIADRLGISVEKLQAALKAVHRKQLDADVKAGRLTAAERDAIVACEDDPANCDPSKLPHRRHHGRRDHGQRGSQGQGQSQNGTSQRPSRTQMREQMQKKMDEFYAALADELGIDKAKVKAAFEAERPQPPEGAGDRGPGGPGGPDVPGHHGPGSPGGPGGGPGGPGFGPPPGEGVMIPAP